VLQRATHVLEEWKATQDVRSCNNQNPTPQVRTTSLKEDRWKKPAPGRYKCNIDAFFSTFHNNVRLDMCLRMMMVHLFLQEQNGLPLFVM